MCLPTNNVCNAISKIFPGYPWILLAYAKNFDCTAIFPCVFQKKLVQKQFNFHNFKKFINDLTN